MRNKPFIKIIAVIAVVLFLFFIIFSTLNSGPKKKNKPVTKPKKERVKAPNFSADSAYAYIQKQVDFGPRNPNSQSAVKCGDWLVSTLETFADKVYVQKDQVRAFDGTMLNMRNIIAEFQPEKKKRIMLFAHWDTRPFADKDTVRVNEPIDGANDGGSGVGILLEIARILKQNPTDYGIDIMLFDSEDYGAPVNRISKVQNDWCLGSQYWSKNPHKPNYNASYGILLDMVGGKNASFPYEGTSAQYAPHVLDKLFNSAKRLGYSELFNERRTQQTTDDHKYVNEIRNIPSACLVEFHIHQMGFAYGKFHHTHQDNMDIISTSTLQAVGDVVMDVIYNE